MDWNEWSKEYNITNSTFTKRLEKTKEYLKNILINMDRPNILSICSGQGRDILEIMLELNVNCETFLIDLDKNCLKYAKDFSFNNKLKNIYFINEDASEANTYINYNIPKCDVIIISGLFGHLTEEDCYRLVDFIKTKIKNSGHIIWTRNTTNNIFNNLRQYFIDNNFEEINFYNPSSELWSICHNKYVGKEYSIIQKYKIFNFIDRN